MLTAPDLAILDPLPSGPAPEPTRKILAQPDLDHWTQSEAYDCIHRFIKRLRIASLHSVEQASSKPVQLIVDLLNDAASWIEEPQGTTTPNKTRAAFQAWLDKLDHAATSSLHPSLVDSAHAVALPELRVHLLASFGSPQRLDYGTGHELSFLAYLLVLRRVGILTPDDEPAIAKRVFADYTSLIRKVQAGFRLEPAGKLGVWGLDEHQHLVYHWGASQARIHPSKRPVSLLSPPNASPNRIAYLFLSTLLHVHDDDPSSSSPSATPAATADEDAGLLRLYRAEVLQRLPVVQHLRFGAVLRWVRAGSTSTLTSPEPEPLPSTGDDLAPAARAALDTALDRRVTDEGTVAPWAIPSLSGETPPAELLERLPSPENNNKKGSAPPSPKRTSPVPLPHCPQPGGALGRRRASRLSISASFDDEEDDGVKTGEGQKGGDESL